MTHSSVTLESLVVKNLYFFPVIYFVNSIDFSNKPHILIGRLESNKLNCSNKPVESISQVGIHQIELYANHLN